MNTGQMMLATGAMVLLGTTVLTVNRNNLNNGTILRQTELGIYAVSLATSYLQRAASLDFDECTVGGLVYINIPMPQPPSIPAGTLTTPANLKCDAGESQAYDHTFDDFDDYNTFTKDTTVADVDKFHVSAVVYYVGQSPPYNKVTANATWLKQMDIKVNNTVDRKVFTNQTGTDTIRMSYIMGFYK
jgi:hypothetical protein